MQRIRSGGKRTIYADMLFRKKQDAKQNYLQEEIFLLAEERKEGKTLKNNRTTLSDKPNSFCSALPENSHTAENRRKAAFEDGKVEEKEYTKRNNVVYCIFVTPLICLFRMITYIFSPVYYCVAFLCKIMYISKTIVASVCRNVFGLNRNDFCERKILLSPFNFIYNENCNKHKYDIAEMRAYDSDDAHSAATKENNHPFVSNNERKTDFFPYPEMNDARRNARSSFYNKAGYEKSERTCELSNLIEQEEGNEEKHSSGQNEFFEEDTEYTPPKQPNNNIHSDGEENKRILEEKSKEKSKLFSKVYEESETNGKSKLLRCMLCCFRNFKIISAAKRKKNYLMECDKYIKTIALPQNLQCNFSRNTVCNQRYTIFSFLPHVLYDQFKFFFNLFFLMVGFCQLIPILRVGLLITYFIPLTFVLTVTIIKEAFDDFKRYKRDKEINTLMYDRLTPYGLLSIPSNEIKVGHIIMVSANQRVPADILFLRTSDKSGNTFIKTDQLDGETDWKLRRAVHATQNLSNKQSIFNLDIACLVEKPKKDIYEFIGTISIKNYEQCNNEESKLSKNENCEFVGKNDLVAPCFDGAKNVYTEEDGTKLRNNNKNVNEPWKCKEKKQVLVAQDETLDEHLDSFVEIPLSSLVENFSYNEYETEKANCVDLAAASSNNKSHSSKKELQCYETSSCKLSSIRDLKIKRRTQNAKAQTIENSCPASPSSLGRKSEENKLSCKSKTARNSFDSNTDSSENKEIGVANLNKNTLTKDRNILKKNRIEHLGVNAAEEQANHVNVNKIIKSKYVESLTLENTIWANTVVTSGSVAGLVIYTGMETRSAMNTSQSRTKVGKLDLEINIFSKILCCILVTLALTLATMKIAIFTSMWLIIFFRHILLLSSIIPIGMRVNLDMAKTFHSALIMRDCKIPGTVVRTSTIPEELGRVEFLLTDKTGTLTQNEMIFKKMHLGYKCYSHEDIPDLKPCLTLCFSFVKTYFCDCVSSDVLFARNTSEASQEQLSCCFFGSSSSSSASTAAFEEENYASSSYMLSTAKPTDIFPVAKANDILLEVCNSPRQYLSPAVKDKSLDEISFSSFNATIIDSTNNISSKRTDFHNIKSKLMCCGIRRPEDLNTLQMTCLAFSLCHNVSTLKDEKTNEISFQAASPDEIALVKVAANLGLKLVYRDACFIHLESLAGKILKYEIIACFPFTSESKRMGIVVKDIDCNKVYFFAKGADFVMQPMLKTRATGWLEEECDNFAREGLRTLVIAMKDVHPSLLTQFMAILSKCRKSLKKDSTKAAVELLENNLDLLALTGVEDKLQEGVKLTLEKLQEAHIKTWMLTGDKVETAICIAISAGLKSRLHNLYVINSADFSGSSAGGKAQGSGRANFNLTEYALGKLHEFEKDACNSVLVMDGKILHIFLTHFPVIFVKIAALAPSVVCCRCSPTQKEEVVKLIHFVTGKRTCAIGDGGNDVSMIQAANLGVGIVGKEGRQASLAADFSITQFKFLLRLLLWHGRNSYQRSARLSQFVIHRGMLIAVMQVLFSAIFYYIPIAIFQGWLTVGYGTYYTMMPVFALIFDTDLPEQTVFEYPMLYASLRNGRILSLKTFFIWMWQSAYQGAVIMALAVLLFQDKFMNIVSICFTSLILSELLNVLLEVHKWHPLMIAAQIVTIHIYIFSMFILNKYFDIYFIMSFQFWAKVAFMVAVSWLPIFFMREISKCFSPPQHMKLHDEDFESVWVRRRTNIKNRFSKKYDSSNYCCYI